MKLSSSDLNNLSKYAVKAATAAGKYISDHINENHIINKKNSGNSLASQVVTEIDLKSQEIILEILEPTLSIYELAVLTEETVDDKSRFEKDYFWCIDPLDGTLPFIESTPGFSVSISLVSQKGIPFIGVIYNPYDNTIYCANKDKGAYKDNSPFILENDSLKNNRFHMVFDRSILKHKDFKQFIDILKENLSNYGYHDFIMLSQGGAAMNACWVLENNPACYFKFPKPEEGGGSLWDYAASACIFNELNAVASDIYGNKLDLNRKDSTYLNKNGILYASNKQIGNLIVKLFSDFVNLKA